jgi:dTDP-4-dehydrorhamnose reductase
MLRLANERDELRVVDDQTGAPTTARLIAATTATVLRAWQTNDAIGGIYHVTAAGSCTWRAFAEAIVRGGLERGLVAKAPRIVPITTAEFPTRARRPAYSVLDCSRLEAAFGLQLPPWQTGLAGVLDELAAARKDG